MLILGIKLLLLNQLKTSRFNTSACRTHGENFKGLKPAQTAAKESMLKSAEKLSQFGLRDFAESFQIILFNRMA